MNINIAESEAQVLSILLVHPEHIPEALDALNHDDFHQPHNFIYKAILALHKRQEPVDQLTVSQWLRNNGKLDECGGRGYINDLVQGFHSVQSFDWHVQKVREASRLRATYRLFDETVAMDESGAEPGIILARTADKIAVLNQSKGGGGLDPVAGLIEPLMEDIKTRTGKGIPGLSSGLPELDAITLGFRPGHLITVAGRPGMGKSALVMLFAEHVAVDLGQPVVVFSLEMSKEELLERMLSGRSRTSSDRMKLGLLQESDHEALEGAAREIKDAPLYVVDQAAGFTNLTSFEAGLARLRAKGVNPALVIIDYIQQVESDKEAATRDLEISRITRRLKTLCQQFGFTGVILSQLSRGVESRKDKRPVLSDLRESGGIEGDSDQVIFVFRDEYYNPETEKRGEAELIVGKNRHGAEGVAHVLWQGSITRFLSRSSPVVPRENMTKPEAPKDIPADFSIVNGYVVDRLGVRTPIKLYSRDAWLKRLTQLAKEDEGAQSSWWLKRYAEIDEEPDKMTSYGLTVNLKGAEDVWAEAQVLAKAEQQPVYQGRLSRYIPPEPEHIDNTEPSR